MKRLTALTLALLLMVLTACGSSTDHVGKTYKTYWFNFKVESAKTIERYTGIEPDHGFKLVDVEISTTNTFGDGLPMYDSDYIIIWGDGEYDWEYCFDPIDDYMCPSEVILADKETMTQHYIFQVPEEVNNPSICFIEYFDDGEKGDSYFAYLQID